MAERRRISTEHLEKAGGQSVNFSDRKGFIVAGEYYEKGDQIDVNGLFYKIDSLLGIGGRAAVWKVFDVAGKPYSLKVHTGKSSESNKDNMEQAVEASAFLDSKYVQKVLDVDFYKNIAICDYVDATLLDDTLVDTFQVERFLIARIFFMRGIWEYFNTFKGGEILHRDIKIENTFVDFSDELEIPQVVFADPESLIKESKWVDTGYIFGTPLYLSPEAVSGIYDVDRDLYAMAQTAARILKGRRQVKKLYVRPLSTQLERYFIEGRRLRSNGMIRKDRKDDDLVALERVKGEHHIGVFDVAAQSGASISDEKRSLLESDLDQDSKAAVKAISERVLTIHQGLFWCITHGIHAPSGSRSSILEVNLSATERTTSTDLEVLKQFREIRRSAGM